MRKHNEKQKKKRNLHNNIKFIFPPLSTDLITGYVFNPSPYGVGRTKIPSIDNEKDYGLIGKTKLSTAQGSGGEHYVVKPIRPGREQFSIDLLLALGNFTPNSFVASTESQGTFLYSKFVPDKDRCMDIFDLVNRKHPDWIPHPELFWGILQCVHRMHAYHVAHRDISPENFVITLKEDGKWIIQIIDLEDSSPQWIEVNAAMLPNNTYDVQVGKPMYMAPELKNVILHNFIERPQLIPTDLWSLGCVFLVLLGVYRSPGDATYQRMLQYG